MSEATPRSDARAFPETHWSQILRVKDANDPEHRGHLDRLLRRYWKPAYHYVRAMRPLSVADAEDLTQGFFAMVLARVDFASLSPDRGSFRGFLKTALRRFVMSHERKRGTQVDRRAAPLFPFAEAEAEAPAGVASPDEAFDRAFAREVLNEMLARLEREMVEDGKRVYFDVFRDYCLEPAEDVSYESLARKHGLKTDDVRNYLRVVRQRGREVLKSLVRTYLLPGENLEGELRFVLGETGGR